jgi:hypothetical protein
VGLGELEGLCTAIPTILGQVSELYNEFIEIKDAMTDIKDSVPLTIESVKILPEGSIDMHASIDEYTDCAPWTNRNSLDSTNPVMSNNALDNPVIELSHFIDDSQYIFVKEESLLMEHINLKHMMSN